MRIVRSLGAVGGKRNRSHPKTSAGRRTVALDAGTVAVLREHPRAQLEERMAAGPT